MFSLLCHPYYLSQKTRTHSTKSSILILIQAIGAKIGNELFEARFSFKKCIKLNPNSAVSYFELSGLNKKKWKFKPSCFTSRKTVDLSPENEWYLANLAILYQEQEEHKKSYQILKGYLKRATKNRLFICLTEAYLQDNSTKIFKNIR